MFFAYDLLNKNLWIREAYSADRFFLLGRSDYFCSLRMNNLSIGDIGLPLKKLYFLIRSPQQILDGTSPSVGTLLHIMVNHV